jgi:rhodanese-related sulfurtransferase
MFGNREKDLPVMAPAELEDAIARGRSPVIVDVRSPEDFRGGHIPGAVNIPSGELEARAGELDPSAPTVFY